MNTHAAFFTRDQTANPWLDRMRDLSPVISERAARWDRERTYCWPNIADLSEAGLMGMTIPRRFGGGGASYLQVAEVVEEAARHCTLTARVLVEANMGGISAVMAYGTDAQRTFAAPIVLAGDKPAICISEPDAGSAATQMTTRADRRGNRWVLNGRKHWITGGGVSRLYLIFARAFDEDGTELGIGGFLVHVDPAKRIEPNGFNVVRLERTMGLCGMPEAELSFDNLEVPDDMVLRTPSGFEQGFKDLMTAYNSQRVGAGTIAMGVAAGALDRAKQYIREREQFGRPLAEFQGLQWMIADMEALVHASRLMLFEAAHSAALSDTGFPDMTKAAQAKAFASENAIKVVNDALQMFGARGYGDLEPLERMYRDVRMFTIGGGTAQILKTQVAGSVLGIKTPQTRQRT
ncbi:3-sulfinopropanoyl-CoA desulfinase [Roseibium sp.]|uniref:3-sulfinopropanoyl-CoA desulfinase n=1 Tax=Roseibium sp. TaxID=1936156 RepID=UPI003B50FFB2